MINQELFNYSKSQREQGISEDTIKKSLLGVGWKESDIDEAFNSLNQVAQTPITSPQEIHQSSTLPKRAFFSRLLLGTFALILILVVIFFSIPLTIGLFKKDISLLNSDDLKLPKVTIEDNNNAYFDLKKADTVLYFPNEAWVEANATISGKVPDIKFMEEFLSRNNETLKYIREACSKSNFQYPQLTDPANIVATTTIENYSGLFTVEKIHILYLTKQGKFKEALDESFLLLTLIKKIKNSQIGPNGYFTAETASENILESIQKIISTSTSTNEELKQYSNNLNNYSNSNEKEKYVDLLKINNYRRMAIIDSLPVIVPIKNKTAKEALLYYVTKSAYNFPYYFESNATKKYFLNYERAKIKDFGESCIETPSFSEEKKMNDIFGFNHENTSSFTFYKNLYFTENALGKYFFLKSINLFDQSLPTKCEMGNTPTFGATQLTIALKIFKNNTRKLPNALSELVPGYLPLIPINSYNGETFGYSMERKTIYPLGTSTETSVGNDQQNTKNPTFKIDF